MLEVEPRYRIWNDLLELIKDWAFAVGLAISCNILWTSSLAFPLRITATTILFFTGVAVIALAAGLFIAKRDVTKLEPKKRTRRQATQAVLLVAGLTLAAWLVVDTTVSFMSSELKASRASCQIGCKRAGPVTS